MRPSVIEISEKRNTFFENHKKSRFISKSVDWINIDIQNNYKTHKYTEFVTFKEKPSYKIKNSQTSSSMKFTVYFKFCNLHFHF